MSESLRLDDAQLRLWTTYHPEAVRATKRYQRAYNWLADDFESDAGLLLCKLVLKYGDSLTPAQICTAVTNRCRDRLKAERRRNRAAFGQCPGPLDEDGAGDDPVNRVPDHDSTERNVEVADLISRLGPRERHLVWGHEVSKFTFEQLGAQLGMSVPTAAKHHLRAIASLLAAGGGDES